MFRWTWHAEAIRSAASYVGAVGDRRVSTFCKTVSMPSRSAMARWNWLWAPVDSWRACATSLHSLTKATKFPNETPNGSSTMPTVVLEHVLLVESRRCGLQGRDWSLDLYLRVETRRTRRGAGDGAAQLRPLTCMHVCLTV